MQPVTQYAQPIGTDAAQILGYLQPITAQEVKQLGVPVTGFSGVDLVGQSGLEQQYDKQLRGTRGRRRGPGERGRPGDRHDQERVTPRPGDDLVTSINAKLQEATQNELADAIQRTEAEGNANARTGAAVVMTTTGRVVAMASYPTYNPSVWTDGISDEQFQRAVRHRPLRADPGAGHPGRVRARLDLEGDQRRGGRRGRVLAVRRATTARPRRTSGGHVFHNDFGNGGMMSLHQALVLSCDTIFYNFAYDIWQRDHRECNDVTSPQAPVQEMQKIELQLGLRQADRQSTCPRRAPAAVPTREWLYYYWKDNAHQRPELVQVRPGQRQLRPADRVRRLPVRATSGCPARRRSPRSARATCR